MNDRQTTQGVVLIVLLFMLWLALSPAPKSTTDVEATSTDDVTTTAATQQAASAATGVLAPIAKTGGRVERDLCDAHATILLDDGAFHLTSYPSMTGQFHVQPLWYWLLTKVTGNPDPWLPYGPEPGPAELIAPTSRGFYAGAGAWPAEPTPAAVVAGTPQEQLELTSVAMGRVEVHRTLRVEPGDPCRVWLDVSWHNADSAPIAEGVWLGIDALYLPHDNRYVQQPRLFAAADGELYPWDTADELADTVVPEGPVEYLGVGSPSFAAVAIPKVSGGTIEAKRLTPEDVEPARAAVAWLDSRPLAPQETRKASFELYLGPRIESKLAAVDPTLETLIPLGFFSAIAWPLKKLLELLYLGIGSWGLAIIALTFIVKVVFFPFTQKSFISMQEMAVLAPKLEELKAKYKEDPAEMQRRTIALYQEHGVNPFSGCWPMLLQMPVWFALFSALQSSTELYHSTFWYIRDLSAADPYMLLPAIVLVLMVGQTWLNPTAPNADPNQVMMMRMMPVVFGLINFSFPAGLQLYMLVNTSLSMLQQWYIRRAYPMPQRAAAPGA